MTDPQTPETTTGTGSGGHLSPIQYWSGIITTLAMVIIMPIWNRYMDFKEKELASRERVEQRKLLEELKTGQTDTHEELKNVASDASKAAENAEVTASKVEEIHQTTSQIAGALPPSSDKSINKVE